MRGLTAITVRRLLAITVHRLLANTVHRLLPITVGRLPRVSAYPSALLRRFFLFTSSRSVQAPATYGHQATGPTGTLVITGCPVHGWCHLLSDYSGRPATGATMVVLMFGTPDTGARTSDIMAASITASVMAGSV